MADEKQFDNRNVSEIFKDYIRKSDLAESSIDIKNRAMKYFIECNGDILINEIGYPHIDDYKLFLTKGRSKSAANTYLRNFSPFITWLHNRGYIQQNFKHGTKEYVVEQKKKEIYSQEEIIRLLWAADLRWQVIIMLGLCSLRRSEILNLCREDLNFEDNYILLQPKKNTQYTWEWHIKNHQRAIVPFPKHLKIGNEEIPLHDWMKKVLKYIPENQPYIIVKPEIYQKSIKSMESEDLYYRIRNSPERNFSRTFSMICQKAAVKHKTFHDLRATFATNISQHMSLADCQKLMRHASPAITANYYIRTDQRKLAATAGNVASEMYSGDPTPVIESNKWMMM